MTAPRLTRLLASHADGITLGRLPPEVIAKAKLCVLDALGCALGGASHGAIASLIDAARPQRVDEASAGASIWARGLRTGPPAAALVNASMAHAVNADDAHKESMGHPGAVVIPAALAVAEAVGAPGSAVIEAVVAGYDCLLRIGIGVGVASHRARGWYATATIGPFGAAAAAAKLLELGQDGIAGAMGHAGAQASGLWAFTADGSLANVVSAGRAAESGVLAALLVRSGLPGPVQILEAADGGFLRAMSDGSDPGRILAELGRRFMILDVSLKPYPCSRTTHAAIDACLALRDRLGGRSGWLEKLSRITVHTYEVAKRQADIPEPATEWMATLSIPYTAAVALVEGQVGIEHFTRPYLESASIRSVMRMVEVVVDEDLSAAFPAKWPCRVEVRLADGERHSQGVESARGDPLNPMTPDEVRQKFRRLTGCLLEEEGGARISDYVERLERQPDVMALASLLREAGRGSRLAGARHGLC